MSAGVALRQLARGEHPGEALLHTARLEALGAEYYGEEAILASFRADPLDLGAGAVLLEAPGFCVVIDGQTALFAELTGDNIARLWRLGSGAPGAAEAAVAVAFDPDLSQSHGAVMFAPCDHPALAGDAAERVVAAATALTCDPALRTRVFVIRASGDSKQGAALYAVYRLEGSGPLKSGFAMALSWWTPAGDGTIRDRAGEAAVAVRVWTPRVGA